MSDSLFGFSSIAAFICTAVLFMYMFYVTYQLHFKIIRTNSKPCLSIVEVWVIFGLFFISTILNLIAGFGWCEDDKKETRIKMLIFPILVTFSCWIYLLVRFGPKRFIMNNVAQPLPEDYFCREIINGNMRTLMGMVIGASFIFHIQCFV